MICPKCKGEMAVSRKLNDIINSFQSADYKCRCGYLIDIESGVGKFEYKYNRIINTNNKYKEKVSNGIS